MNACLHEPSGENAVRGWYFIQKRHFTPKWYFTEKTIFTGLRKTRLRMYMETIRPDKDDLHAHRPRSAATPRQDTIKMSTPSAGRSGSSHGGVIPWLLVLALLLLGGGFYWWGQDELKTLHNQLAETQDTLRQSKLALARFEGKLTETGQELQQSGSSLTKTLQNHGSELHKLDRTTGQQHKDIAQNAESIRSIGRQLDALDRQLQDLSNHIGELNKSVADVKQSGDATNTALQQLQQKLDSTSQQLTQAQGDLKAQIDRRQQERVLSDQEVQARLDKLEKEVAGASSDKALQSIAGKLKDLQDTVSSIDASRAQLNARLIQLNKRVDALASKATKKAP